MGSGRKSSGRQDAAEVEFVTLANTWQLRFDIPVDPACEEIAKEFARSWTELLEAQKLTSIVSSSSHPLEIEVQVCSGSNEGDHWSAETVQIVEMLRKLSKKHQPEINTERVEAEPGEWQGFRLWMTFERQEAEKFFDRKKPRRRFGARVFKKIYSGA
jgi:hypothetical protein